jgi:hypothetical protein
MKYQKSKERAVIKNGNNEFSEELALGILMNKIKTNETVERKLIINQLRKLSCEV